MRKGNYYIESEEGNYIKVTKEQKKILLNSFIVYPEYSHNWLINKLLKEGKTDLFDFRLRLCKVQIEIGEEYMVVYFSTIEEAMLKYPDKQVQILSSEEFDKVNKQYLEVNKQNYKLTKTIL